MSTIVEWGKCVCSTNGTSECNAISTFSALCYRVADSQSESLLLEDVHPDEANVLAEMCVIEW